MSETVLASNAITACTVFWELACPAVGTMRRVDDNKLDSNYGIFVPYSTSATKVQSNHSSVQNKLLLRHYILGDSKNAECLGAGLRM